MRTTLYRHKARLKSLTRQVFVPGLPFASPYRRPPLTELAAICRWNLSRIMSITSTASSTTTNTSGLTDACCEPGSASTYPSNLNFPAGREIKLAGVDCYSVNEQSSHLVLYSSDIFGWRFANNRQNADQIAAAGFHVVVPDMFDGEAVTVAQVKEKGMQWVQSEWIARNPREERAAVHSIVLSAIQQQHGSVASVQAVGFCYGAPGVLQLYEKGLVTSGVVAHPSGFTKDNAVRCNKPTLFNCAETDAAFTPEIRRAWEQTLNDNHTAAKFVDYPGTSHGFAVRDDGSAVGVAARQRAIEETVAWLKQHVAA